MRKGSKDADRFPGLDQQRLIIFEILQRRDDRMICLPAARGPAGPAVYDEIPRILRHVLIEVVHQHPHGGFLMPAFAGDGSAPRRAYRFVFGHSDYLAIRMNSSSFKISNIRSISTDKTRSTETCEMFRRMY